MSALNCRVLPRALLLSARKKGAKRTLPANLTILEISGSPEISMSSVSGRGVNFIGKTFGNVQKYVWQSSCIAIPTLFVLFQAVTFRFVLKSLSAASLEFLTIFLLARECTYGTLWQSLRLRVGVRVRGESSHCSLFV